MSRLLSLDFSNLTDVESGLKLIKLGRRAQLRGGEKSPAFYFLSWVWCIWADNAPWAGTRPYCAAFSRSRIAPQERQTATPGLIFSAQTGQSSSGFGS